MASYNAYQSQPYPYNTTGVPTYYSTGINWVQGEAGAKSFTVMAGQSVMLMDSENNVFYIKSTDASGMPLPLRIFDYTERNNDTSNSSTNIASNINNEINMDNYVTRQEFDDLVSKINSSNNTNNRYRKKGRNNDESSV